MTLWGAHIRSIKTESSSGQYLSYWAVYCRELCFPKPLTLASLDSLLWKALPLGRIPTIWRMWASLRTGRNTSVNISKTRTKVWEPYYWQTTMRPASNSRWRESRTSQPLPRPPLPLHAFSLKFIQSRCLGPENVQSPWCWTAKGIWEQKILLVIKLIFRCMD